MILKLDMKHQGEALYKVYINDPVMTLTSFTARSTKMAYAFEWGKMSLEEKNLKKMGKWTEEL